MQAGQRVRAGAELHADGAQRPCGGTCAPVRAEAEAHRSSRSSLLSLTHDKLRCKPHVECAYDAVHTTGMHDMMR